MKKNIITSVLATTLFFYGYSQQDNTTLEMGLSFELEMEHETLERNIQNIEEKEPCVILDYVLEDIPTEKSSGYSYAPKFLSSLYLFDFGKNNISVPTTPSVRSIAYNTVKENTFFPWLEAIDYGDRDLHSPQHIPKGFGPLISM